MASVLLCTATVFVTPAAADEPADDASLTGAELGFGEEGGEGWRLAWRSEEEARLRAALSPDETDIDTRLFIAYDLASPSDELRGDLALGFWWDIDGVPAASEASGLSELRDARDPSLWLDLYALALAYETSGILREARLGRQVVDRGQPLTLDGLSLISRPLAPWLELFGFGGRSVHFFEVGAGLFDDWVASAGAVLRPLPELRFELDYRFHYEETELESGLMNHAYGLDGRYRLGDWLKLRAFARGLDASLSHVGGALQAAWPGQDLGVELQVRAQPTELGLIDELDNPYVITLGRSAPHLRWRADAWKAFPTEAGTYSLHLGGDGRHLLGEEPSPFNRDFGRLYLEARAVDVVVDGPYLSLVLARHGERFDFAGHGLWAVSGAAGYAQRAWRLEAGSSYDSYKYTYYQSVDEIEEVRTVYAEAMLRPLDFLSLRGRYMYERFAWDVHTVTFGLVQLF